MSLTKPLIDGDEGGATAASEILFVPLPETVGECLEELRLIREKIDKASKLLNDLTSGKRLIPDEQERRRVIAHTTGHKRNLIHRERELDRHYAELKRAYWRGVEEERDAYREKMARKERPIQAVSRQAELERLKAARVERQRQLVAQQGAEKEAQKRARQERHLELQARQAALTEMRRATGKPLLDALRTPLRRLLKRCRAEHGLEWMGPFWVNRLGELEEGEELTLPASNPPGTRFCPECATHWTKSGEALQGDRKRCHACAQGVRWRER